MSSTRPINLIGQFQPGARRRLDVDDELAGVGAGKVRFAHQRIERQAHHEKPVMPSTVAIGRSSAIQHPFVAIQHLRELAVEPGY
jgi:hypothetical protein